MSVSSEQETKRQTAGQSKWNRVKTLIVIAVIICALFFARSMINRDKDGQQTAAPAQAPLVVLHTVHLADLAAEREYVGRVDPIQAVSLSPQVSGEIAQVHFRDGSIVKAGQLLFTIDDKTFQAAVEARKADLAQAEANYNRAVQYFNRLKASDSRSVSAASLEGAESDMLQGKASVGQAKAALKTAQLNLGYTKITAPISGRAGKAQFTKGNLVSSASELTTIVQTDPIRITFSLPDKDFINQLNQFKNTDGNIFDSTIRLANGNIYPVTGERDFENNQIDTATGTITISLRYKNQDGLLIPGSMVRIALKPTRKHIAPVIPMESILADSQGDYVYVVDAENKAQQRRVSLGVSYGVVREVLSGIEPDEKVIIKGVQAARHGMEVRPAPERARDTTLEPSEIAGQSAFDVKPVSEDTEGKN